MLGGRNVEDAKRMHPCRFAFASCFLRDLYLAIDQIDGEGNEARSSPFGHLRKWLRRPKRYAPQRPFVAFQPRRRGANFLTMEERK